jgi:N-acetylglucosamine kinase-like BadF-type ATPase
LRESGLAARSVIAGLTGYGGAVADDAKALLAETFGAKPADMIVINDIVLAYIANFAPGEGHLVSAGTGSIGVHIARDGSQVRVGGRGILIDDAGSGSWIALRALDQIYRVLDHTGSFDGVLNLARQLLDEIGGEDWHDVRQFIYSGDRGRIGSLAVAVARAADEGDPVAVSILQHAGAELARLADALISRVGNRPVGLSGGVLSLHPVIVEEIRRNLVDRDVRLANADASLVAAQLQVSGDAGWGRLLAADDIFR